MPIKHSAFTLVELMVAMTIFFVMMGMSYAPYSYYMSKSKVRTSYREIAQSLYDARNMAINGTASGSNVSVGLYLDTKTPNILKFFAYPYTFSGAQIVNQANGNVQILKTYTLQEGITFDGVDGTKNALFFFDAISGNGHYYTFDTNNSIQNIQKDKLGIYFSYKWAKQGTPLAGVVWYITPTNIVDY